MAEFGTAPAFFGALAAHGLVRRTLFTDSGTEFTHFDAERTEADVTSRGPSHPLCRKDADVRAIAAEPDAANHQAPLHFLLRHFQAGHLVATRIANARAVLTDLNALEPVRVH